MRFSSWWKRPLTALGHARFVEGVGFPKLVSRRFKRACCIRCSGSIPGTDRRWWRKNLAPTHNQANKKMNLRLNDAMYNSYLTVSLVTGCSVHRPRRQGFASPRKNGAPLTAAGAGRDHLVTSETVRVRHGK
jgi:hypothetical protein